ncbi:MAG: acyl carrier protein [Alphaproteobacteria bacterium]|nr:acyl carrier protein [Alphaproteobacteria bacterium]
MTNKDIEALLRRELFEIAPDINPDDIDRGADLREEFDIDSMDFLNLVVALAKNLELDIPETDYSKMSSYDDLAAYLRLRMS